MIFFLNRIKQYLYGFRVALVLGALLALSFGFNDVWAVDMDEIGQHNMQLDKKIEVSGVFVKSASEKILKTANETYLLIDKNNIIETVKQYQPNSLIQSFRVCLLGYPSKVGRYGVNHYPYVLLVDAVCEGHDQDN